MLCDISHVGVRYDSDSLDALVMIANEAKLVDHCPKTPPSRQPSSFDDHARKTAGCLDVRVDRLREFHEVVLLDRRFWMHVQDGMLGIEVVFDHLSLLYKSLRFKGRTRRRWCAAHGDDNPSAGQQTLGSTPVVLGCGSGAHRCSPHILLSNSARALN